VTNIYDLIVVDLVIYLLITRGKCIFQKHDNVLRHCVFYLYFTRTDVQCLNIEIKYDFCNIWM